MNNDLKYYEDVLLNYAKKYDEYGDCIKLKTTHMLCVTKIMDILSNELHLDNRMSKLSHIVGLFHDVGRYEQIKKYNTFLDVKSEDHADLSEKIIRKENFLNDLPKKDQELVCAAIKNHNKYSIEDSLDEETIFMCKLIRDADKIDVYRVVCEEKLEATYQVSTDMLENSKISDAIYQCVMEHKSCSKKDCNYPIDHIICCLAFVFDINFDPSFKLIKKDNYYLCNLDTLNIKNTDTKTKLDIIFSEINNFLDSKVAKIS